MAKYIITILLSLLLLTIAGNYRKTRETDFYKDRIENTNEQRLYTIRKFERQLRASELNRLTLADSLSRLTDAYDSILSANELIEKKLSTISGRYNNLNSKQLQDKMIEGYEQRGN
jgi:hypothetical protein